MNIIKYSFFILFISVSMLAMDFSNNEMSFDSEEVEKSLTEQPEARALLDKGIAVYKNKKYRTAANYFFKVLDNPNFKASFEEANFNLGKSARKLNFNYLSLYYFSESVKNGETSPFFNPSLKYFTDLSKTIKNDTLLENISKYDPKIVPQKYKNSLYYIAGKYSYKKGKFARAVQYLKLLPKSSKSYLKSRYLLSVLYARLGKGNTSIDLLKEVIDYNGKVSNESEYLKLKEMSIIAIARIYYQMKDYDRAILYFNKVPRFSMYWLDAVFESSWAYLMKGDYAKSLGNLVTLRSPSFYKEFYPEKYFIEAIIYYNNCDYKETNKIVQKFLDEYRPLRKSLTSLIKAHPQTFEFYNVIKKSLKDNKDPKMKWILKIALSDKAIISRFNEIKDIDNEIKNIKKSKNSFLRTKMATSFLKILDKEKKDVEGSIGEIALQRFKRVVNKIRKLLTDVRIIKQAILEIKEAKITKELISLKINKDEYFELDKEKIIMSTPEDFVYWPFEGEYWKDELGYYLYPIVSQCNKK
jgi:tetratricopeptide (TPR) repeat protein